MIDEEETFKRFGYHSTDLAPHSSKKIIAVCDGCGKVREVEKKNYRGGLCPSCVKRGEKNLLYNKHRSREVRQKISRTKKGHLVSEETKRKISEALKGHTISEEIRQKMSKARRGKNHPLYGKHRSKETKRKISTAEKGRHPSEETCKKLSEARRHQRFPTHHTEPELIFGRICKKYKLPFRYTGDGSFWIENVNPDFVECNGKKIAVEIFGDYWHSPLLNRHLREDRTLPYRKKILRQYGWKLVVLWGTDLKRGDAEEFVLVQLKKEEVI